MGMCLLLLPAPFSVAQVVQPEPEAPASTDATAQRIIDLHAQARGGWDNLRKMETLRLGGKLVTGTQEYRIRWWRARPHFLRVEQFQQRLGWDYETVWIVRQDKVWQQERLPEQKNPVAIEDDTAKLWQIEADLLGPLLNWRERGHVFTYGGESKVLGRPSYHLVGHLRDGSRIGYDIDQQTFLVLNMRTWDYFAGRRMAVDRMPTGVRRVNGIWVETGYDYRVGGESYKRVDFEEIAVNQQLEPALFAEPSVREIWLRGR
jgi:hypothetical protein